MGAEIAGADGGRIEAASEGENKGTTFSVWLPLAVFPPGPAAKALSAAKETEAAKTAPMRPVSR